MCYINARVINENIEMRVFVYDSADTLPNLGFLRNIHVQRHSGAKLHLQFMRQFFPDISKDHRNTRFCEHPADCFPQASSSPGDQGYFPLQFGHPLSPFISLQRVCYGPQKDRWYKSIQAKASKDAATSSVLRPIHK